MNYPTLQVIRQSGSFRQIANALDWSLTARRLVELGDFYIAQSTIVQTDIIQTAIEPMRHMKPAPTNGVGIPALVAINAPFL